MPGTGIVIRPGRHRQDHSAGGGSMSEARATTPTSTAVQWSALALMSSLIVALWMAAYYAARMLEYADFASLWFPPTAVSFAAFAVLRWRAWPALIVANVLGAIATFQREGQLSGAEMFVDGLGFAFVHCVAFWLAAEATLQSIPRNAAPSMARTVGAFLLAGIVAALIAAVGGVWVAQLVGLVPAGNGWATILPWLIGDYAGLIATGPLMVLGLRTLAERLRIHTQQRLYAFDDLPRPQGRPAAFVLKLLLVLGAAGLSLLAISQARDNQPLLFIVFIAIVLQLWIVHTQGAIESLVSIALFSLTVVVLVFALDLDAHALTLQFAMITLAAGSYFGLAVPMLYADNAQLRRLLVHDGLTGAYNRHFFVELSQQAIRQARMRGQPVSMLMLDLDNLKLINDRHGHAAGDRVLAQVAQSCQRTLSGGDLFGRLGGDEFCALLPGHDQIAAAAVGQRLVDAVRDANFQLHGRLRPSLSVGIATLQNDSEDYDSLWLRADSALYVAKRAGRDQVAQEEVADVA
jgi:diguanylate cyclase (GGDEF)-like protein